MSMTLLRMDVGVQLILESVVVYLILSRERNIEWIVVCVV